MTPYTKEPDITVATKIVVGLPLELYFVNYLWSALGIDELTDPIDPKKHEKASPEKREAAHKLIDAFENNKNSPSVFKGLEKSVLIQDLRQTIEKPFTITQIDGSMDCGIFAIMYMVAVKNPEMYVTKTIDLYTTGTTNINGHQITASDTLKNSYSSYTTTLYNTDPSVYVFGYTLRKNWNLAWDIDGSGYWASTSPWEMKEWLEDVFQYEVTEPEYGYELIGKGLTDKELVKLKEFLDKGNHAVLLVNGNKYKGKFKKGGRSYGNHFIVVNQIEINEATNEVKIDVFDYGKERDETFNKDIFQYLVNATYKVKK